MIITADEVRTSQALLDAGIGFCSVCGTQLKYFQNSAQECPHCGCFQLAVSDEAGDRVNEPVKFDKSKNIRPAKRKPRRFTTEEDNYILKNSGKITQKEMGKTLGRLADTISSRLLILRKKK